MTRSMLPWVAFFVALCGLPSLARAHEPPLPAPYQIDGLIRFKYDRHRLGEGLELDPPLIAVDLGTAAGSHPDAGKLARMTFLGSIGIGFGALRGIQKHCDYLCGEDGEECHYVGFYALDGPLATIGAQGPKNLSIVVLDNEHYGETGMQPSLTSFGADLGAMAAGAGFKVAETIWDEAALMRAVPAILTGDGPALHAVKVKAENYPRTLPPSDGAYLKDRFRQALLGPDAIT